MLLEQRGYKNKILYVDLTTEKIWTETLDEKVMRLLLGGKGLGSWLLYKHMKPKIDPLSPENVLIFVVGPLTGTTAPTSSRFGIVSKSPASHTFLDSYCGGFFGQMIKYAGYDAIVINGAANSPKVLVINDDDISIDDGSEVWNKNTHESTEYLTSKYGADMKTAVIGPPGERCVPIAGIFCDVRTLGRGGAGAVMGSKKLKAIAIKGSGTVEITNQKEFENAVWVTHRMLRMSSQVTRLSNDGTVNILDLVNASGALPTRNFQSGEFEEADKLTSKNWKKDYWIKSAACFGCPMACTKISRSKKHGIVLDGPEYETIFAMGSNCGVTDHEAIIYANYLCDLYGIDTMSTGAIIAFVMELYQKKMISTDDLSGIKATWGSGDTLIRLTEIIATGEGIGELLSKGVREISKHFPGSEEFSMHVKGLEMPGYLARAAKGIGLSYAISERGACHLKGSPLTEILGGADPLTADGKAALFKSNQLDVAVVDSAILCYFVKFGITLKEIFQIINPCTGFEYKNPKELEEVGERIITLTRLFNTREGFSKKDDILPKRSLAEPIPSGNAKGHVVELDTLRSEYYNLMGWNDDGIPTEATIQRLALNDIL
ncbi:aldehyde ferredoxin oxidoreductase family protein [candidate division KSB1 bacterium]|nr:aldehyde ferredoxin oxidoreductase family protein [candidate division KSB1 bacterium]